MHKWRRLLFALFALYKKFPLLGFTHHQGSFLALTPGGDVVVQHGGATEDAVRQGLRRLATTERSHRLDYANVKLEGIEETENSHMVKQSKENDRKDVVNRVSQRWPTIYSIVRDNSSKFKQNLLIGGENLPSTSQVAYSH